MYRICRRRHGERGAVLVELAMVTPVILGFIFAILDFGSLYGDNIDLRQGVREASWNGSRAILGSAQACTLTSPTSTGNAAADTDTRRLMCMAKLRSRFPADQLRIKVVIYDPATNTVYSGDPSTYYLVGKGILVCAMRGGRSLSGFFTSVLSGTTQRSRLANVIVATSSGSPSVARLIGSAEETPLTGRTWSFCSPTAPAV